MSINIRMPNGVVEVVQDCPRDVTCKQCVVGLHRELLEGDFDTDRLVVLHDGVCVDERPLAEFDG